MKLKLIFPMLLFTAFSAFSSVIITQIGAPQNYFVDASQPDNSGDGLSWVTAKQTIQAAVDLTVDGDTVWVTNGIYDADGAAASGYSLMNRVCVTNMITVRSVNGPKTTVIDGSGSVRGVYMIANSVLSGFTVTNGVTLATGNSTPGKDNNGGGIYAEAGSCLVTNCVIAGNRTANGTYSSMFFGSNGGCSGYGAGVCGGTLIDCILIGNRTGNGLSGSYSEYGDGYNGGSAGHGGGAYGSTLIQCLLFNNLTGNGGNGSAGDAGGDGGNGGNGGGAYNCTTVNCTAYGNTTGSRGNAGSSTVWGVTPVSGADGMGSGTYGGSLKNCIIWGNSSDDVQNAASVSYTCAGNVGTSNGNITSDPQFIDAAKNDFQLQSSSPCINAGNNADAPAGTDLAGNPRIIDGTVDMGAYEYVPTVYYVDALQSDDFSDGTSWATAKRTLQAAVDSTPVDGIVWVTNGTYLLSAEISITNSITIRSVNGPDVTVIDGCGSNRCFSLSGACIIGGFTITNGYSLGEYPYSGGGVYCANEQSVVSNCVISGNRAAPWGADLRCSAGGGMSGGTAIDCIFRGNKALSGGGISDGTAFNCAFIDNTAEGEIPMYSSNDCDGGGMSYGFAYNCTFTSNSSEWCCGGIAGSVAYNCDFDGNVAVYGGGGAGFFLFYFCRIFCN
ncbi:MAG: choice-of-anchor Q domain-containing protein [Kiritimatiellales bacterium]